MSMQGVDHVVVRVKDLDAAIKSYEAIGFTLTRVGESPAIGRQAFFNLPEGGFLELVAPLSPESAVGRAIERNGEGVHTIAMAVDDLEAATKAMAARGVQLIGDRFVHPKSAHGVLVQLVDRKKK
jgi:methylmalonyl-CoA epimerase